MAPTVRIHHVGGRLKGREEEHTALSLHTRELRTLDAQRREWRWLVPLGICKDSPFVVLVDPVGAVEAARDAGLRSDEPASRPSAPARQEHLW